MAVDRLGVVLVAGLGSAEAAGAWTAITRLLGICLRVVHAMSQALNAKLPALLAAGRTGTAMGQAQLATWWTIALLTPVLSVTALFPNPALALFGMQGLVGPSGAAIKQFIFLDSDLVVMGSLANLVRCPATLCAAPHLVNIPPRTAMGRRKKPGRAKGGTARARATRRARWGTGPLKSTLPPADLWVVAWGAGASRGT